MALPVAHISTFSTLTDACLLHSLPGPVPVPVPASIPIHVHASGKENYPPFSPRAPHSGKRILVPTKALTPSPGRVQVWPLMTILFNPNEGGVRFDHVLQGFTSALRGCYDFAFPPVGQGRAEFRILWPGYAHMDRTFNIQTTINDRPITRWELAHSIVLFYTQFWEQARRANVSRGNECWDVRRFDSDDLVLVSVSNTHGHDAVFQAVVEAARP